MHTQDRPDEDDLLELPSFRSLYALTVFVGILVAADLLLWWWGFERLRNPAGVNLALIAAVIGGARIVYSAVTGLLEGNIGADLALALATVAAILLREYWVAAEVVLIAMVGESLEAITYSRTQRELTRIFELRPRVVHVRRGELVLDVALDHVRPGDVAIVRPGERIPGDGVVALGRSSVDQSTLTGESVPIDKGPGDPVYAGTLNQFGALEITVERVGEETTLGQVIQLVAQARRNKANVERIADRMARYFLPFVLALAGATFVVTNAAAVRAFLAGAAVSGTTWTWMPTLAVLVVACPCALVLATPAAMMAAMAWMARRGVLATGGAAVERLARVNRFAFDKTGTLTAGKLEVGDCIAVGEFSAQEVLRWAACAEQGSEHLIGQAIVRAARAENLVIDPVEEFRAMPGAGVLARRAPSPGGFDTLLVGTRRLMLENHVAVDSEADAVLDRLEHSAQTPLLVALNGRVVGVIGVRDTVRSEAAGVIAELRGLGVEEIVLLTGDRAAAAEQVARAVGIERYVAELRPEEKANWLADWCGDEGAHGGSHGAAHAGAHAAGAPRVAMVGDGVNDAPALATADVGLALGGVGSNIAAEAGDMILMGDPLSPLPGLVRLARQTVRVILQNILVFAFGVNLVGVVLTGWIMPSWSAAWMARSPVAAAVFHQLGSVLVLLNAMRLLWFERGRQGVVGRLETVLARRCWSVMEAFRPVVRRASWLWRARSACLRFAILVGLAIYLGQILIFVQPDEVALVRRFGRFRGVLPPGPHLRLPPPWETITRERPARVRTLMVGLQPLGSSSSPGVAASSVSEPVEWTSPHLSALAARSAEIAPILTGDQSLVELVGTVQYRVVDLRRFRFGVRDPERVLEAIAEGVVREVLADQPLLRDVSKKDERLEVLSDGRGALEQKIRDFLQARAESLGLGIEILPQGVCLQDLHPPRAVVAAFRDVSSAFKEKERMGNEAQAYYREKLIKAAGESAWRELGAATHPLDDDDWAAYWTRWKPQLAGEASATINSAQAFADQRTCRAQGDAASFHRKLAVHQSQPRLTELRMFLDALSATMPGKPKVILDRRFGGRRQLFLGLPEGSFGQQLPLVSPATPPE